MAAAMRPRVYLAGPIKGLVYAAATDWREAIRKELDRSGIDGFSPLRAEAHLKDRGEITDTYFDAGIMTTPKGIVNRDRNDVRNAQLILVNLLDADRVSIGTVMELGWADAFNVPSVVVLEAESIHDHAMIREVASFLVSTLEEGLHVVRSCLLADPHAICQ